MAKRSTTDIKANYLARDFKGFESALIDFARQYFPNQATDLSEATPGRMLLQMMAYMGDNLAYYQNEQFKELIPSMATEKKNIVAFAQSLYGYRPRFESPGVADVEITISVPDDGTGTSPDYSECPKLLKGSQLASITGIPFMLTDDLDFARTNVDETILSIETTNADSKPLTWLITKKGKAAATSYNTFLYEVPSTLPYRKIALPTDQNIIEIVSVDDNAGNKWWEVDYLAQDVIFREYNNTSDQDNQLDLSADAIQVPYILKLFRVPRRFVVRVDETGAHYLIFGSGDNASYDEDILPNPIDYGVPSPISKGINELVQPQNFLRTRTFGVTPAVGTLLTIKYRVGGGLGTNVPAGSITQSILPSWSFPTTATPATSATIESSVYITNPKPATGGDAAETIQSIKLNSQANYLSQARIVTLEDYVFRTLSMPAKYGIITKAFAARQDWVGIKDQTILSPKQAKAQSALSNDSIATDSIFNSNPLMTRPPEQQLNPNAINLYVLSKDVNGKLTTCPNALKYNLANYLSKYRMVTDAINILDPYIVNIGMDFTINVLKSYNKQDVIIRVINALRNYFDTSKWEINQPIFISDVEYTVQDIEGVQNVVSSTFYNKTAGIYSNNVYDLKSNTYNGIIQPPKEIAIFEVKHPTLDIRVNAV